MTQPRVLIVDDDQDTLDSIRRALSRQSYRLSATTSPREACKTLQEEAIDLILSDVQMPEINGLELMRIAKTTRPEAIRILLTGTATLEVATFAINEGEVHRLLSKPFDSTALRDVVANALARKRELDRTNRATRLAELRHREIQQLEEQHPGITHFDRDDRGAYLLPQLDGEPEHEFGGDAGDDDAHSFDELAMALGPSQAVRVTDRQWGLAVNRHLEFHAGATKSTPTQAESTGATQDPSLDDFGHVLLVRRAGGA